MYAVEFEAPIENGIVRIPKEYKDLQEKHKVKFFVIYDDMNVDKQINTVKSKKMNAISIDTIDYKFNREEAHER